MNLLIYFTHITSLNNFFLTQSETEMLYPKHVHKVWVLLFIFKRLQYITEVNKNLQITAFFKTARIQKAVKYYQSSYSSSAIDRAHMNLWPKYGLISIYHLIGNDLWMLCTPGRGNDKFLPATILLTKKPKKTTSSAKLQYKYNTETLPVNMVIIWYIAFLF